MGCGASTENGNDKEKQTGATKKKEPPKGKDSRSANGTDKNVSDQGDTVSDLQSDTEMSEQEREQVRRIKSNRKKQFTLSNKEDNLNHYQVATFQISEEDAYYTKQVETRESKPIPPDARRRSSLKPPPSPNRLTASNLAAAGDDELKNPDLTSEGSTTEDVGSAQPPGGKSPNLISPKSANGGGSRSQNNFDVTSGSGSPSGLKKKVTWTKPKK